MAVHDVVNDPLPQLVFMAVKSPKVSSLRTALTAYSGTSYPASRLNDMTKNDMIYAARIHGLTVANPT
jgi:hypothetical protein